MTDILYLPLGSFGRSAYFGKVSQLATVVTRFVVGRTFSRWMFRTTVTTLLCVIGFRPLRQIRLSSWFDIVLVLSSYSNAWTIVVHCVSLYQEWQFGSGWLLLPDKFFMAVARFRTSYRSSLSRILSLTIPSTIRSRIILSHIFPNAHVCFRSVTNCSTVSPCIWLRTYVKYVPFVCLIFVFG